MSVHSRTITRTPVSRLRRRARRFGRRAAYHMPFVVFALGCLAIAVWTVATLVMITNP